MKQTRRGYNQTKALLLQAVRSQAPTFVTSRQVLDAMISSGTIAAPSDYLRELRVVGTRLLSLSTRRDPDGRGYGYARPYLQARMTHDELTGRRAMAYRLSAKGAAVLAKMEAGQLRGIRTPPPRPPRKPRVVRHDGQWRDEADVWACGLNDCSECYAAYAAREHPGTTDLGFQTADGELAWDCGLSICFACEAKEAAQSSA